MSDAVCAGPVGSGPCDPAVGPTAASTATSGLGTTGISLTDDRRRREGAAVFAGGVAPAVPPTLLGVETRVAAGLATVFDAFAGVLAGVCVVFVVRFPVL